MTPEQKKTLLEMSLLMRKNREKEREEQAKRNEEARERGELIREDIAPLDQAQAEEFARRRKERIAKLSPEKRAVLEDWLKNNPNGRF